MTMSENFHPQLLKVPELKKKKRSTGSNNTDRSLSPSSPAELRMNISGDFSDIMDSDEESHSNSSFHQGKQGPAS
jgi:hypothetical protein